MRKQTGYTLTELLVVLLLLSLITAIGPVAVQKLLPGMAVNSAMQTLRADLQALRIRALTSASPGELQIDNDGRGYILLVAGKIIKRRKLGNAVRIRSVEEKNYKSNEGVVLVGADGRLSGLVLVVERRSKIKRIQINPIFGTAEVVEVYD